MNWKEITEKCPKSFKEHQHWLKRHIDPDFLTIENIQFTDLHIRNLYDFFDERKIYIEVNPIYDWADECIMIDQWDFTVTCGVEFLNQHDSGDLMFSSRPEAEEMAFMKAFELLERQLNEEEEPLAGKL